MDKKLYDLMNWERIESIVYSDNDEPGKFLGAHAVSGGILVQAFFPDAVKVLVVSNKRKKPYEMELVDEAGFFAVLIPGKKVPDYHYEVVYAKERVEICYDPYVFPQSLNASDLKQYEAGVHYTVYEKLGAHVMVLNGVEGVSFAVWAPNAVRVSVVGDFNFWDGRRHPMNRLGNSGIFQLFIPGLKEGEIYKYEIKVKGDLTMLKSDPFAFETELRPNNASVICNLDKLSWNDEKWRQQLKTKDLETSPVSIYEVHLGSFKKPEDEREFYNYRELADMLADYLRDMHYTHIELLPIMEHPLDESWGYQVTGYYAPTKRYGTPEDFAYFINKMHASGIGVILDWVPAHFPRDGFGLAGFDGTCLYEHLDPRQGSHPHWGTLIYNYKRPQVANFLIANALFWAEKYHIDGIRMDAVASMLYLDYGKQDGEWIPNIYGGNENLDAVEFLRHLNTIFKKRNPEKMLIAEESTAWPLVTGDVKKDGLGFDFKWNMGWMNDFTDYMRTDPLFRKGKHGELLFSMVYAYSEKFFLIFSHDEVVHGKGSMIQKMPGDYEQKFAGLRLCYGFMMAHPGKKLLFMGQEFGQFDEWSEKKALEWELLSEYDSHKNMQNYVRELNKFYQKQRAFYELDYQEEGFEWVSSLDADHSVVTFLRKTEKIEETMFIVCNFTPVSYDDFTLGVPFKGKYKEVFNSDRVEFGGSGFVNPRVKLSKEAACDGRDDSIKIKLAPLAFQAFTCTPVQMQAKTQKGRKKRQEVK